MKTATRRKFIRNASLTATGVYFISPIAEKKNLSLKRDIISCAPDQSYSLYANIASVQSGNWSDPATWGGVTPGVGDTPSISNGHNVVYDLTTGTFSGVLITIGGTLTFDPTKNTLLQSSKNFIVEGILRMKSANATITQTLRFINIDETKFVGGGMNVLDTDIGLWVMGGGQLDLEGARKTSWTNATGSIAAGATTAGVTSTTGWLAGDEISIAPTEPPTVGAAYTGGFDEKTITAVSATAITLNSGTVRPHPKVNNAWTAEVMNLSRNVKVEGTPTGRAHIFIRSTNVQNIKFVAIRYMGPRKDRNGDGIKELVAGRYGLHMHHCMNGSRGSLIEGNVIRDCWNHSYVPHISHGVVFLDNIAYNVLETAFWFDPGDPTNDVVFDHNIVAICKYIQGSLNFNAEDAPTFSSSGFALNTGDGCVCKNNVVVGGSIGDVADGGAYNWEAVINEGVWIFTGNVAHNNACGLRVWQNSTRNHVIEDFICYHNGLGIFHGAYANSYTYNGGWLYGNGNGMTIKAASVNSNRVRLENFIIDGAGITDYGVEVIHSPLPGDRPVILIRVTIRNCKIAALNDSANPEVHSTDMIHCDVTGPLLLAPSAVAGETIRVMPLTGQPYKITHAGTTPIAPFAATLWGTGKGLKAEYFNGTNFTNPAFTRIDSNISFSEWSAGVHYALTGNSYCVRWTGQIEPQYSEVFTFQLGSGGGHRLWVDNKLILDGWQEHYPDAFLSSPIALVAGQKYDIKVEYFNTEGGTGMGLQWKSASLPLEYVPQSQLYTSAILGPPPANQPPVANAGADITITLPVNNTTLNGSASHDPDGTINAYLWTKISGPAQYNIGTSTAASTVLNTLVQGTYVFRLKVTDNKGAFSEDDVTVTVNPMPANQLPVARAGADITLVLPTNTTTLNGSTSADPDGTISTYLWTKINGPTQFTIANPNSSSTAISNLVQGSYIFRLKVTDNLGAVSEDDVMVTVNPPLVINQPPVAKAGPDVTISLPTNSTTLNGSASTDPDGSIQYAWTKVSGPQQSNIVTPAGSITVVNNLAQGVYVFNLKVTDNRGATSDDQVTVTVLGGILGYKPPVANAGSDIEINLPLDSVILNGTGSIKGETNIVEYKWTKISGPLCSIVNPFEVSTRVNNLQLGTYIFRLQVTDQKNASSFDDVTVTVKPGGQNDDGNPLVIQVMPNPSTSYFTFKIKSSDPTPIRFRLFDNKSRLIERKNDLGNDVTIRIGAFLKAGTYFAVVEQGRKRRIITLAKL